MDPNRKARMPRMQRENFIVGKYSFIKIEGHKELVFRAEKPKRCCFAQENQMCDCKLERHSVRTRKTLGNIKIDVFYCHTHGNFFAVYPEGSAPYLRLKVFHENENAVIENENNVQDLIREDSLELLKKAA